MLGAQSPNAIQPMSPLTVDESILDARPDYSQDNRRILCHSLTPTPSDHEVEAGKRVGSPSSQPVKVSSVGDGDNEVQFIFSVPRRKKIKNKRAKYNQRVEKNCWQNIDTAGLNSPWCDKSSHEGTGRHASSEWSKVVSIAKDTTAEALPTSTEALILSTEALPTSTEALPTSTASPPDSLNAPSTFGSLSPSHPIKLPRQTACNEEGKYLLEHAMGQYTVPNGLPKSGRQFSRSALGSYNPPFTSERYLRSPTSKIREGAHMRFKNQSDSIPASKSFGSPDTNGTTFVTSMPSGFPSQAAESTGFLEKDRNQVCSGELEPYPPIRPAHGLKSHPYPITRSTTGLPIFNPHTNPLPSTNAKPMATSLPDAGLRHMQSPSAISLASGMSQQDTYFPFQVTPQGECLAGLSYNLVTLQPHGYGDPRKSYGQKNSSNNIQQPKSLRHPSVLANLYVNQRIQNDTTKPDILLQNTAPPPGPLIPRAAQQHPQNMLVDIAKTCQDIFPFEEIAKRHNQPIQEVFDTFSAIIQLPLLRSRTDPRRPGRLGSTRMREFREAKKAVRRCHNSEKKGAKKSNGTKKRSTFVSQ